jgi:hypothetical protein
MCGSRRKALPDIRGALSLGFDEGVMGQHDLLGCTNGRDAEKRTNRTFGS